jgi:peptidoglycan/xylan/chitin deacetylase (PgdA/CDA1 family)
VGSRAAENPALIRRIVAEGHELGNHSYWHPDLSKSTEQRTRL